MLQHNPVHISFCQDSAQLGSAVVPFVATLQMFFDSREIIGPKKRRQA
ncbi:MAG: hypothetical protein PHD91_03600 [bacterium]|jgi:hypothetical protein|nr:hypothetical protein [bacterium]